MIMMYGSLCTEFYDADKPFATKEELKFYKTLFSKDDFLLEPMCGSGRFLIPLLRSKFNIEGFDNSTFMLASCRQRANDFNLNPVLYKNSIGNFLCKKRYQGIIIPLGSFQLLYPREKACEALAKFHQWLSPGGKLVMDLFVPWEALYKHGEKEISKGKVKLSNNQLIKINSSAFVNKLEQ
jgi:SAM-dependent methyltransferase